MKKETWSWIAGGTLFAAIAGVWFWQLPNIIKHTAGEGDNGLSGIFSSLGGVKDTVSGDLQKAQVKLEANMKDIGEAVDRQNTQTTVIEDLKQKITNRNEVKAATVSALESTAELKAADQAPVKK